MTLTNYKLYIVNPTAAVNLCTNPSFESATTGWGKGGANTIAVSTAQARRGVSSCLCTYQDNDGFLTYSITLTAATYTASADIYIPTSYDGTDLVLSWTSYTSATIVVGRPNMTIRDRWQRVHTHITPDAGDLAGFFYVYENGTNATAGRFVYVDGVQIELGATETTYFDGYTVGFLKDEIEYYWNGSPNASTSTRTVHTRSGGTLVDLSTYGKLLNLDGFGMSSYNNSYADLVGGGSEYQKSVLVGQRAISILMQLSKSAVGSVQAARAALYGLVKPSKMRKQQPLILRYQGFDASGNVASEPVDIHCHYESGLEAGDVVFNDRVNVTFTVPEGVFHKHGEDAKALGYITTVANIGHIMQRSADGIWASIGTGLNGNVYCMAIHPITGDLYIGGDFTDVNGTATTDYLVKWNGTAFVEVIASLNQTVEALTFASNGDLYIGGNFTNAGGVPAADYICKWDGSTVTALGTGTNGLVSVITISDTGTIYIGGNFTLAGGVADTVRLASWNGSVFSPIGTGVNAYVSAIAIASNGDLYIGGNFTDAGGVPNADYIARISGSTWYALGTGMNTYVRGIVIAKDGTIYIGGFFTAANGNTAKYVVAWNGVSYSTLKTGLNNYIYTLFLSKKGDIYAGGTFTGTSDGVIFPDRMAIWTGSIWLPFDINVQDLSAVAYCFAENKNTGTIYVGGLWAGTDALSATVTVPNVLGSDTYPILYLTGPGLIYQVKNYTTGQAIYFDNFTLLAGESVKIDLRPGKKTFISSYRGNIGRYVLDGSDIDFKLIPGNNNVSVLITGGTAATTASMVWQANYNSIDEANYDS